MSARFGLGERDARLAATQLQDGLLDQSFALHLEFAAKLAKLEGLLEVRRAMIREVVDKLELLEAQAGSLDAVSGTFGLTNALDVTIGTF